VRAFLGRNLSFIVTIIVAVVWFGAFQSIPREATAFIVLPLIGLLWLANRIERRLAKHKPMEKPE